jgi:hypothetical protein
VKDGLCFIQIKHHLVHKAPSPILSRFDRLNDRVASLLIMLGRVFVFGRVTASNMSTYPAHPKMHPRVPHLQTFFAAFGLRLYVADLIQMGALAAHDGLLFKMVDSYQLDAERAFYPLAQDRGNLYNACQK